MVKSGLTTSNKLENIILIFLYTSISLSALFFFHGLWNSHRRKIS